MKKSNVVRSVTSFVGAIVLATSAWAVEPHVAPMTDFAKTEVVNWIKTDVVISAIKDQNQKYANLAQADIDTLDKTWRAETSASDRPMINAVLASELSQFLATIREKSDGLVTEIFVMDNKGLNVGQSDITSDFWQGDEAKWQKTYLAGPDAIFVDGVEQDESTQAFQSQLSMSIVDPQTGDVIGAITVGVNVDAIL